MCCKVGMTAPSHDLGNLTPVSHHCLGQRLLPGECWHPRRGRIRKEARDKRRKRCKLKAVVKSWSSGFPVELDFCPTRQLIVLTWHIMLWIVPERSLSSTNNMIGLLYSVLLPLNKQFQHNTVYVTVRSIILVLIKYRSCIMTERITSLISKWSPILTVDYRGSGTEKLGQCRLSYDNDLWPPVGRINPLIVNRSVQTVGD